MSFSLIVFNFLLCRFETMAGWIDVHAQFNGGEPQRLKVRCLGVMLRGLKDEIEIIIIDIRLDLQHFQ